MMPAVETPRLSFAVEDARPEPYAQAPTMRFGLRITEPDGSDVESIALGCQIRIEPNRRRYEPAEQELLADLFGEPSRWGQPVPWGCESRFELPVSSWRAMMDLYFPGGGWLRLGRAALDGLTRHKARQGLLGWDEVVEDLLKRAGP